MSQKIRKVLILGSGALKIGEAGEFDYSGSQAIKALKDDGIKVVLVNPNIATVQTSKGMADEVYFLPVNRHFVTKIVAKERPDGLLLSFGGQTALNCGIELHRHGVLKRHGVKILGTPVEAIIKTEDRGMFNAELKKAGLLFPKSKYVNTMNEALKQAQSIGYPVMVRSAFALGGRNSGIAKDAAMLKKMIAKNVAVGDKFLIEECLVGWKEVEYEVVRDSFGNCVTVCNMENFDPLGIHTGESIVVAPSQTLNNYEYHWLREIAIKAVRHFGIVGECNIQYALNPQKNEYRIIEINARLSRSSALASKATGYPLAYIAAKLALGYSMTELQNAVTQKTIACFEPALDYITVKIPRWDLKKFNQVSKVIGTEMKSVGEVMAIGRSFEEALQKALRMLNVGVDGLDSIAKPVAIRKELRLPTDQRVFMVAEAFRKGLRGSEINRLTGIDRWFLYKIRKIIRTEQQIKKKKLTAELLYLAKQDGFSDKQIAKLKRQPESKIRSLRQRWKIKPVVKQIDTLAAEYPAQTNYLYLTYHGTQSDNLIDNKKASVMVIGGGPYSIGSSVEFDWCAVNAGRSSRKLGYQSIMINCNPETVSTDYDESDKLYFEELTAERVLDIIDIEKPKGVIVSVGGQIPNNLAKQLQQYHAPILGTQASDIDRAEDRHKFSALLDRLDIDQPGWKECRSEAEAKAFAKKVGYPILIRPSYVLSGAAMSVAFDDKQAANYLKKAVAVNQEHPVVVSKFISGAKEIEFDAVAQKGKLKYWVVGEHIENAGVHSGDASIVLPTQKLYAQTIDKIIVAAGKIAKELRINGPFNIQFLAINNEIKVIECNLRASRTMPFISKVKGLNIIELATKIMLGEAVKAPKPRTGLPFVAVKAPQFSFSRLRGADPVLTVEMSSTGEVACFGNNLPAAYLKSLIATGVTLPRRNIFLSLGGANNKIEFLDSAKELDRAGFNLFATPRTHNFLSQYGIESKVLHKASSRRTPNVTEYFEKKKIELV
ncbi:MAG: carbamoyl phosphate synthase large subunit, partial [Candidatus Buchananbacteria bacterium CG10_big_fil_rev_8_21_14_0_10_42_9]